MLIDKKVLLCVTGGIAVYKAAALTSKLTQEGAQVRVIMSESARKFVTPLTFQALSRNDVGLMDEVKGKYNLESSITLQDMLQLKSILNTHLYRWQLNAPGKCKCNCNCRALPSGKSCSFI